MPDGTLPFVAQPRPPVLFDTDTDAGLQRQSRSRFAQAVQMLDDRYLVRNRAVKADPAHGPRTAHRRAQVLWRHLAIDITPVQAMVTVRRLDHRHGRILCRRL